MVPDLKEDSLISGRKTAEAGYVLLLTPDELIIPLAPHSVVVANATLLPTFCNPPRN